MAKVACPTCKKLFKGERGVASHKRVHKKGGSVNVKPRGGTVKVKPRGGNVIDRVKSAKRTYSQAKTTAGNVGSAVQKGIALGENTVKNVAALIQEVTRLGPQLLSLGEQVKHTIGFGLNPFEGVERGEQNLRQVSGNLCRICRVHDIVLPETAAQELHYTAKGGALPLLAAKLLLPTVLPFILKKLTKPLRSIIPGLGLGQIRADVNHVW